MQSFLKWLDCIAETSTENSFARWLERTAFFFLILMILAAPNSIAATQIALGIGMSAWLIRLFLKPRLKLQRTPLDLALWIFFGWTVLSSIFSYAPDISIDKLRNAILFLIFYFIVNVVRTKRAAAFLAFALIFSCMISVLWMPIERITGRGVEIYGLKPESIWTKAKLADGDTILEADKRKVNAPEELVAEIERNETTQIKFYRPDFYANFEVKRENLQPGKNALEKLGIENWKHSRNWRSAGFYSHYVTYAEVLQLIASLTFGLFIALIGKRFFTQRRKGAEIFGDKETWRGAGTEQENYPQINTDEHGLKNELRTTNYELRQEENPKSKIKNPKLILAVCLVGMVFALLLTVTRASQAAFLVSAFTVVFANGNRKMLLLLAAVVLPLALGGLLFLQQSRNVGFLDPNDNSITWRETVYREGFNLWTDNPRNFLLGVGMDSIRRYAKDWHLFDDGKLPPGHFHSTPLQIAVERGLPALVLWFWILWIYARTLLRYLRDKSAIQNPHSKNERGIILGSLGGLIGFFTSGLVHYNYGDAVVAMMFFILMGLSVKIGMRAEG